jgi:hypothetical protein
MNEENNGLGILSGSQSELATSTTPNLRPSFKLAFRPATKQNPGAGKTAGQDNADYKSP